ncbi:MAG TPA: right-handed parallel beta-helix repeat-containing protein [Anaerolineales bacterium]|nr:right-handed parallel beta-helix repeat-containing protein [Anaerolineales bacterium]
MKKSILLLTPIFFLFSAFLLARHVRAQVAVITVNSTSDLEDFGGAQQVGDLPGPDGLVTLREALTAANNTLGSQTVAFNIPTSDPGFNGQIFIIFVESTPQFTISDDGTIIDGTTQTAFSGDTNPFGPEIHVRTTPPFANLTALTINANSNTVTGLTGLSLFRYGIRINGNNNVIKGNVINQANSAAIYVTGNDNLIGGTLSEDSNRLSSGGVGVWIVGPAGSGNRVIGNDISGSHTYGVHVDTGTSGNIIGGPSASERNIISRNGHTDGERNPVGANVAIDGTNNLLQGNYIGLDSTGAQSAGNIANGVEVTGSFNQIIDNVISGHNDLSPSLSARPAGILIHGDSGTHDLVIQGNRIGTDASGVNPIPNQRGVRVAAFFFSGFPHNIIVGGAQPGEANTVAFSSMVGVLIDNGPTGINLSRNSIHSNEGLGIDLNGEGVTPNDPGDGDTGANNLQNFPVIQSAIDNGTNTVVSGFIDTQNPANVILEFFSNDVPDPSGFGEGQQFEGSTAPDANGNFMVNLPGGLAGKFITATATDAIGNTSEFSAAVQAVNGTPPTPPPGPTPTPTPTPTATTPPPPSSVMHVSDLDGGSVSLGKGKWQASVIVTVHDGNHNPLAGVVVSGAWSGGFTGTAQCLTSSQGLCSLASGAIQNRDKSVTFVVSSLSLADYTYTPADNHDRNGDSDGTNIIILKP